MPPPYTLIWTDDQGEQRNYTVDAETILGRLSGDPTYRVVLRRGEETMDTGVHDPSVSRVHARLEPREDGIGVHDVGTRGKGSTNGTYVNEERVPPGGSLLARPGDIVRFGLYTVMRVAERSGGKNVVILKPGESVVLPREKLEKLPEAPGIDVAEVGAGKVAVYFSGDVPTESIDLGDEKIRVARHAGPAEKRASMLLDMRLKLVEAKRLLEFEPPRLEEAAVKLAVLVRIRRYRDLIQEAVGPEVVEELEAAVEGVRSGRTLPGLARRLSTIASELLEVVDSLRHAGV